MSNYHDSLTAIGLVAPADPAALVLLNELTDLTIRSEPLAHYHARPAAQTQDDLGNKAFDDVLVKGPAQLYE